MSKNLKGYLNFFDFAPIFKKPFMFNFILIKIICKLLILKTFLISKKA